MAAAFATAFEPRHDLPLPAMLLFEYKHAEFTSSAFSVLQAFCFFFTQSRIALLSSSGSSNSSDHSSRLPQQTCRSLQQASLAVGRTLSAAF